MLFSTVQLFFSWDHFTTEGMRRLREWIASYA